MKKYKYIAIALFSIGAVVAQDKKVVTINEVISIASTQTTAAQLADIKVKTKEFEWQVAKNKQLPDFKISGQYQRLSTANVELKLPVQGGGGDLKVNQLLLGNATLSYPLFAGFKVRNNIELSKNLVEAEKNTAEFTKEEVTHQAIQLYVNLYKAQQSQKLIQENQKRALQRVKDFKAMMDNGIIAKNDYLKAELQVSNYQIAYEEAVANEEILSYQLALLLKMNENSKFQINDSEMNLLENLSNSNERKDVRALTSQI